MSRFDWNKLPDSPIKWELIAYEKQLDAVEDSGPTSSNMITLCLQFRTLAEEVKKWMEHLLALRLYAFIPLYKAAVDVLLARVENVNEAAIFIAQRTIMGERPEQN